METLRISPLTLAALLTVSLLSAAYAAPAINRRVERQAPTTSAPSLPRSEGELRTELLGSLDSLITDTKDSLATTLGVASSDLQNTSAPLGFAVSTACKIYNANATLAGYTDSDIGGTESKVVITLRHILKGNQEESCRWLNKVRNDLHLNGASIEESPLSACSNTDDLKSLCKHWDILVQCKATKQSVEEFSGTLRP